MVTYSLYAATMVILKISLGIFYLRIIVSRWQRVTVYVTVGIAAVYGIYYFFGILFECGLPSDFLANAIRGKCNGTRQSRFAVNMTAGIINAVSDIILVLLPMALIKKACMPLSAKISASLVLLLGCVGTAISIVRLVYIHGLTYNLNFFASGVNITLWSIIEAGICITAASLATLRPLCRCCIDRTRRSFTSDYSTTEYCNSRCGHPSSTLSFQDRNPASHEDDDWPLKKPEPAFPSMRELDDMRTPTPGFSDAGVTRKASLINGKMTWLETTDAEPRQAPKRPARPDWPSSDDHPAYRHKPAMSASKFSYNPAQLLRTASKSSTRRNRAGSKGLQDLPTNGEPRLEEVGVGAWRVCEDKGDRRG